MDKSILVDLHLALEDVSGRLWKNVQMSKLWEVILFIKSRYTATKLIIILWYQRYKAFISCGR